MTLVYETIPAFEDTWIECLGDLGRYRMAIEDDDVRDREIWKNCARFWYTKAADKTPNVGRLYHHLAILALPNIVKQLFLYCKSLAVVSPFHSSRVSILTVFHPLFNHTVLESNKPTMDSIFIQIHAIMFTHVNFEKFDSLVADLTKLVQYHIEHPFIEHPYEDQWRVRSFYLSICNITALYDYGAKDSTLRNAWKNGYKSDKSKDIAADHGDTAGKTSVTRETLLPSFVQNERPTGADEDNENAEVTTL
ncbi:Similar to Telomerase-binding protein EST1A; acc. no. Q5RAK6 [Pyronema omphalodes CBS 100304]|uniref:Similar to Telomerase-binding protein EST1A acc. no. Q5RAK6 n=1 Tax=Pyronema omphalodes (strain CBS 100304) TaxID=1076935 RepID=U4LTU1_PYROM|nr:Similar to Telomerase-binding protein EST1A; acc. no. Q5RAK6 [Pyronema omphalodes CBS 100304]